MLKDLIFMVSCIKDLIKKKRYSLLKNNSRTEKVLWLHEKKNHNDHKKRTPPKVTPHFVYCAICFCIFIFMKLFNIKSPQGELKSMYQVYELNFYHYFQNSNQCIMYTR